MPSEEARVDVTRFVTLANYAANRPVEGEVVTILASSHEARGLRLIPTYTRALRRDSIHELIATDETSKKPGDTVDRIAYLAFFEVSRSGMVIVGESLLADDVPIGTVLGFDETHEPNHINIVIGVGQRQTGKQLKLRIGSKIRLARDVS
jgi:hypothetical protein